MRGNVSVVGVRSTTGGVSRAPRRSPVVRRHAGRLRAARGRGALFASAYPRLGSSIYLALGLVAIHGLGLTPVALVAAGLAFAAVAVCYAEGVSMFPEAGGSAALARHAFDELASFLTGWAMCLALVALAALSAAFVPRYLSVFWAPLATSPWAVAGGLVVIGLVALASVRGVEQPASLAVFLGIVDLAGQLLLVLLGAVFIFRPEHIQQNVHLGAAPSFGQLILACAVAMVAYTGIETIAEMAGEARDPDRDLPIATAGVLASAVSVCAAISLVALMAMPVAKTPSGGYATLLAQGPPRGYVAYPVLGIVSRVPLHVLSTGLRYVVGLLVAAMLLVTTYAAVRAASRLACWLAQHHQAPARVAELHPRYETPYLAIAVGTAAAAALVVAQAFAGGLSLLAGTYVFGALLAFTSVQVSVVAMRWRDPGRYRPFQAPLSISVDGRRIPVLAILGTAFTASAWIAVVLLEPDARYLGSAWLILGFAWYAAYRRHLGFSLTERTRRDVLPHAGPGIEVEFQTMLIPVNTDQPEIPADVVEVAAQLAAERRASLVLLAFTQIPLNEEMDMEIDDLDRKVERLAASGRTIGERYGVRVHTTHLRTRDPAESILAEATRRDSQVILLRATGLQRTPLRRVAYDQIVRRIVTEAKQRVMIIRPEQVGA
jgi:basic amino acid/polyamine antiporter, APA family